ncbi:MAG: hypothetical protein QXU18_01025 [Thermoplasmatales archaeon]
MEKNSYSFKVEGALFLVAFIVAVVILVTDKNLQTDFGIQRPYFIHWYGMLVISIVSFIAGVVTLASKKRSLGKAAAIGSGLLALFLIADVATFAQVGFKSASQFATYLFGITKYPGSLSYIPGLYDLLFALFVIIFIVGIVSSRNKINAATTRQ